MNKINFHFKYVFITIVCALVLGCASKIPRMNPYAGLLPEGYQLKTAKLKESPAELKTRSLGMVAGANFEKYTEHIYKNKETIKSIHNSPLGMLSSSADRQSQDDTYEMADPKRMTMYFAQILQKSFNAIAVYPDIASAKAAKVDYIVILDYSFNLNESGKNIIYGQVDLLNQKLEKTVSIKSEIENDTTKIPFSVFEDVNVVQRRSNLFVSANIKKCLEELGFKFNAEINKK
jgi:hypothetical protein